MSGRAGLTDGPHPNNGNDTLGELFKKVSRIRTLEAAWRKVRSRGLMSSSNDIRAEVLEFDARPDHYLRSIQAKLISKRFEFAKQIGIAKKRQNKSARPIVVAPLHNKIVQRAVLDVLPAVPKVREVLDTPTSVGGIAGVDSAVALVVNAIGNGATWYVRSDIPGFFTKIPKPIISRFIAESTDDPDFARLFDDAMAVELANADSLGADASLFPTDATGVAQGSALSPLIGNILLSEFDHNMNRDGIVCVRYIDDFLILGHKKSNVEKAFLAAKGYLGKYGLDAYNPAERPDKASMGETVNGFDFLGCRIKRGLVQPSTDARNSLLENVRSVLKDGRTAMAKASRGQQLVGQRYAQTLTRLDRILKGWSDAFAFCNGRQVFNALDERIDKELDKFRDTTRRLLRDATPTTKRRVMGVHCLSDTPQKALTVRPRKHSQKAEPADTRN